MPEGVDGQRRGLRPPARPDLRARHRRRAEAQGDQLAAHARRQPAAGLRARGCSPARQPGQAGPAAGGLLEVPHLTARRVAGVQQRREARRALPGRSHGCGWQLSRPDDHVFECERCRRSHRVSVRGVCPTMGCGGKLAAGDARRADDHYRFLYRNMNPVPLTAREHTAQLIDRRGGRDPAAVRPRRGQRSVLLHDVRARRRRRRAAVGRAAQHAADHGELRAARRACRAADRLGGARRSPTRSAGRTTCPGSRTRRR